jgi:hypothetical protein
MWCKWIGPAAEASTRRHGVNADQTAGGLRRYVLTGVIAQATGMVRDMGGMTIAKTGVTTATATAIAINRTLDGTGRASDAFSTAFQT